MQAVPDDPVADLLRRSFPASDLRSSGTGCPPVVAGPRSEAVAWSAMGRTPAPGSPQPQRGTIYIMHEAAAFPFRVAAEYDERLAGRTGRPRSGVPRC